MSTLQPVPDDTDEQNREKLRTALDALSEFDVRPDHDVDVRRGIAQTMGRIQQLLQEFDDSQIEYLTLDSLDVILSSDLEFCPWCGCRDDEPVRHSLEEHPERILARLDELAEDVQPNELTDVTRGKPVLGPDGGKWDLPDPPDDVDADGPPTCNECGHEVSYDYARVFSNDERNQSVPWCYECKPRSERY